MIISGQMPPVDKVPLLKFLDLAEVIRKIGENYVALRAVYPLLDKNVMWKTPPDFPLPRTATIRNLSLGDEAKRFIEKAPAVELDPFIRNIVAGSSLPSEQPS